MGLYEAFKDVITVAQKADNVELYRQLLDLSAQALDMQAEIARLKEENTELKKRREVAGEIIRHDEPCVTLRNDNQNLFYCSHCWDSQQLLIQLNCHENGTFECPHCKATGNYNNELKRQSDAEMTRAFSEMNSRPNNLFL